jgi:hypothetical protein
MTGCGEIVVDGIRETRRCGAPRASVGTEQRAARTGALLNTPLGLRLRSNASGKTGRKLRIEHRKILVASDRAAVAGRGNHPLRGKVIGHGMPALRKQIARGSDFLQMQGALTLLDQPAGKHGGGVLLNPLVEKGRDLLAEIGGMTEPGEFIALKRAARGREKKLPRGLGRGTRHMSLLEKDETK